MIKGHMHSRITIEEAQQIIDHTDEQSHNLINSDISTFTDNINYAIKGYHYAKQLSKDRPTLAQTRKRVESVCKKAQGLFKELQSDTEYFTTLTNNALIDHLYHSEAHKYGINDASKYFAKFIQDLEIFVVLNHNLDTFLKIQKEQFREFKGSPERWFVCEGLGKCYSNFLSKEFGYSKPSQGSGEPYGPFIRFVQKTIEISEIDICTKPRSIIAHIDRYRQSSKPS